MQPVMVSILIHVSDRVLFCNVQVPPLPDASGEGPDVAWPPVFVLTTVLPDYRQEGLSSSTAQAVHICRGAAGVGGKEWTPPSLCPYAWRP